MPKGSFKSATLLLIFPFLICPAVAQTYQIEDFSDDYYAIIKPNFSTESSTNGGTTEDSEANVVIDIISTKTKKTVISQPADIDIEYELDNGQEHQLGGKLSANIVSLPYGESSILIYDDFNFDGQKDVAVKDGRNGCYGGPSYQVYLKRGNTFVHSEAFTELAQGNCGFFGVDEDGQTLSTMTKSGAAWHQFSDYKVINNKPVAIHIIEEEIKINGLFSITESTRVNGKMVVERYDMLPMYDDLNATDFVYTFDLDNGKKMVTTVNNNSSDDGGRLSYVFVDKDGRVELYYDGPFVYDTSKKTLSFTNKPVRYQINSKGITVKMSNKTVLLKSQPNSVRGSLDELAQFGNVSIRK